ncbi:MAG: HAD-IIIA family hydrolase [Bacteroidetes bacterium]|nr:HAD-IIIA family hydrolase [Bacteroidota bacterium]MBS1684131.1 HAD-IIIA family hydrolase [Bacteroidota bacterium]
MLSTLKVDKKWTLFLDRDGVINLHYPKDYVKTWDEFFFLEGAIDAIVRFSQIFGKIIVVTNQQGVAKGKMTEDTLRNIHLNMLSEIEAAGGRIDSIYAATVMADNDPEGIRKPRIGMALQAQQDFPEIDFAKSLIVGDSISDMQFGRNAGMFTVMLSDREHSDAVESLLVDYKLQRLSDLI